MTVASTPRTAPSGSAPNTPGPPAASPQATVHLAAQVVNHVIHGVSTVFDTALGVTVERSELGPFCGKRKGLDVNAFIDLDGSARGRVWLSFHRRTAIMAATRMLDMEPSVVETLYADATGELVNMIAGLSKAEIAKSAGLHLNLHPPQLVDDFTARRFPDGSVPMRIDFHSPMGPFFVAFGFAV